ncbi:MAG TPA: GTPase HflX [Vicinamibacteria bacterium]|nr:GTPase HflX [Vicinamibacteria bacterium]
MAEVDETIKKPNCYRRGAAEHALLIGVATGPTSRSRTEASLEELGLLARSAGASVVGTILQERPRKDPATLIGRGKVEELSVRAQEAGADVVIFDHDLSPAQQRNLEERLSTKTLDRTQLILDIFAKRARTREGRLQVELAQLEYLLPRLAGKGVLLSRLGGGIGTRGPGETKLETDRRRIRQRIQAVRRDIERVRRHRGTRRAARQRSEQAVVALVGYTNAGKSTLFSALTRAEAGISDQLFMTLDPLVRRARLGPGLDVLLVDTVGFIQKLPHGLVAAFRATLEEVVQADLLLHVQDASAPDLDEREASVNTVLEEIGAAEKPPRVVVLNKSDRLDAEQALRAQQGRPEGVLVSAHTGHGLEDLRQLLIRRLWLGRKPVRLRFSSADARGIAGVYSAGKVVVHEVHGDEVRIEAELPERLLERYREHLT